VNKVFLDDQPAANARGGGVVCVLSTRRRDSLLTPPVPDRSVFAAVRPSQGIHGTTAAKQQIKPQPIALRTYENMTRIAAAGGSVSGSHPAWDPV